jgi:urea transporter
MSRGDGRAAVILLATGLAGLLTALGLLGLRTWAATAAVIFEGANLPFLLVVGLNFDAAGAASDPQSFLVFLGIFVLLPLAVVGLLFLPRLGR